MTAPHFIDPARFLSEQLEQASPDLMRQMLTTFINALMSAEAEAVCGAEYGQISADRINSGTGISIPAPAPSTSRSQSCAPGPTSRTGSSSAADAPRPP